jgi:hypothetical protein
MDIDRQTALNFIAYFIDDAGDNRRWHEMPQDLVVLVGWRRVGREPLFIAVWSHLGSELDADRAERLAVEFAAETGVFPGIVPPADYIL